MTLMLTYLLGYCLPLAAAVVLVVKVVGLWQRRQRLKVMLKDFPGPEPHWLRGNASCLSGDYSGLLRICELATVYPGIVPLWTGPFDCTLLATHPAVAKAFLSTTDAKDEFSYSLLKDWLGEGLLLSHGGKWNRTRRMLTSAFSADLLRSYVNTFCETSAELVDKWRRHQGPVEVFRDASLLTMDSMLRCLFGHSSHCQQHRERHPYVEKVHTLSQLVVERLYNPLLHWHCFYRLTAQGRRFTRTCREVHQFSKSLIAARRAAMQDNEVKTAPIDFLHILLSVRDSEGNGLSEEEIEAEVDTFLFAGHDSTASALSWTLYCLARHSRHQQLVRQEARHVMAGRQHLAWEDLSRLQHTTRCIYESMRLFPPVPNLSRVTGRPIILPDGRVVPPGVRVGVSMFAVHRHSSVWQQAEEFQPERFESDEMCSANVFMPFSLGPRNCIGQHFALTQLRVAVTSILRNFRVSLVEDSDPVEPVSLLILRSKHGLNLELQPLHD